MSPVVVDCIGVLCRVLASTNENTIKSWAFRWLLASISVEIMRCFQHGIGKLEIFKGLACLLPPILL